jgi:CRP/FNR family transcriptional regulator, cyclic AMP receptor protein
MISPELLRRYPIFSGLSMENVVDLAKCAEERSIDRDSYINLEGDELKELYLLIEGEIAIISLLPRNGGEIIHSTIGAGELFNWSALIPPYTATAATKAMISSHVVAFDAATLRAKFTEDCDFGYVMVMKIAQVIRDRLNTLRIETMAYHMNE